MEAKIFDLHFFQKGVQKTKSIKIKYIPQSIIRDYFEITQTVTLVKNCWDRMSDILTLKKSLKIERPENYKDTVKALENEYDSLAKKIIEVGESDFFEQRFKLVKKLLEFNGVEDSELLTLSFWEDYAEPTEIIRLLDFAVFADGSYKKKAL